MSILKIRDADGKIREILAIRGDDGHTPIKGTDYYTEEDQEKMVADAAALVLPVQINIWREDE